MSKVLRWKAVQNGEQAIDLSVSLDMHTSDDSVMWWHSRGGIIGRNSVCFPSSVSLSDADLISQVTEVESVCAL